MIVTIYHSLILEPNPERYLVPFGLTVRTLAVTGGEVRVRIPAGLPELKGGADGVGALSTPDHRPGDEPDATTVLCNIRLGGRICQSRPKPIPFNPKDELREQSSPLQTSRDHFRPL